MTEPFNSDISHPKETCRRRLLRPGFKVAFQGQKKELCGALAKSVLR
jgi:hypothetical protein